MKTKAIRVHKQGGPEEMKWETVDLPTIKEGEILIKHTAIGLNYIDTYHRSGLYPMPVPFTLGLEGAGIIADARSRGIEFCTVTCHLGRRSVPWLD